MLPYKSFTSVHLHKLLEKHKDAFDWSIALWNEFGTWPKYQTLAHTFALSVRVAKNIVELGGFSIENPCEYAELLSAPRPLPATKKPKKGARKRRKYTKQDPKVPAKYYVAEKMVYFIKTQVPNAVKIGYSSARNLHNRLDLFQTANPSIITLLATIPGGLKEEKELHSRFADLHVRGEWFRYEEPLVSFILSLSN